MLVASDLKTSAKRRKPPRPRYRRRSRNVYLEMEPVTQQKVILNNGIEMPLVGRVYFPGGPLVIRSGSDDETLEKSRELFTVYGHARSDLVGTYRIRSSDVILHVVESALAAGYRMFDTATVYGNERYLGEAFRVLLPKFGLTRQNIFITTKLSPKDAHTKDIIKKACLKSLNCLGVEYIDMYLIHFPGMANLGAADTQNIKLRCQAWEALVECYNEGLVKAIGVSNYTIRHLQELEVRNFGVVPAVNQVECHPYFPQRELLQYCRGTSIALQAYCSLGGTSAGTATLLNDPVVINIAKKLNVTVGQLLLVWSTQQGISVIPKSTHVERIKENISLNFKIPDEDIKALEKLGVKNIKYAWDPSHVA